MSRYVWDDALRDLVEIPLDWKPVPRPRVAVHGVKPDFKSMADGKWYNDHGTYAREVKARGYEIVGNETDYVGEKPKMPPASDTLRKVAGEMGVSVD